MFRVELRSFSQLVLFIFGLAFFCPGAAIAQSQSSTGSIEGVVRDETGAVLPGATVTVRSIDTGLERTVVTDEQGIYRFHLLPVGQYELGAELTGFSKFRQENFRVNVGATVTINISLKVAGREEIVTVSGDQAPVIQTSSQEQGSNIGRDLIDNLPLSGRNFINFFTLTPGAFVDQSRGALVIGGQRGINNQISVDGADYTNPFFGGLRGGGRAPYVVSQDAVQEFQIVKENFSAEFGRSTGSVVNVVTRGGTNKFRGSAFYYIRDQALTGKDAIGREPSEYRQQQFGGSFGGPVIRDRAHFLISYDRQEFRDPLFVFFGGGVTEIKSITPAAILSRLPKSVQEDRAGTFLSTNDVNVLLVKNDFQLNSKNQLTTRYNYSRDRAENGTTTGGRTNRGISNNGLEGDRSHTGVAQLTTLITNRLVNEARFNYSYEDRPRLANEPQGPEFTITGVGTFGRRSFLPITQDDNRLQYTDNLSYIFGKHDVKIGVDYNRTGVDEVFVGNIGGVYRFDTLADYQANRPSQLLQFFGAGDFRIHQTELALYAQDRIKINPALTMNVGLRWESLWNPQPHQPNPLVPQTSRIPHDKNNFAPRFGLSWDPEGNGKSVIRLGGGIYYARTPSLLLFAAFNNNGFRGATYTVPGGSPEMPTFPAVLSKPPSGGSVAPEVFYFEPEFQNPRSAHGSISYERQVAPATAASIEYTYSNTVHLQRLHDANLFPPAFKDSDGRPLYRPAGTRAGSFSGPLIRPNRSFGRVSVDESSARSLYNELSLKVTKRFAHRFAFRTHYTLAYNNDDDSNERNAGGIEHVDAFDLKQEYGPSDNDIRHSFAFAGTFDLPGGIRLSNIMRANSGRPFSATTGVDNNGDNNFNDRPIVDGKRFTRNQSRQQNFFIFDLRVAKSFNLAGQENHKVELIAEFFNLFGTENLFIAGFNRRWGTGQTPLSTFGVPNEVSGDSKQVQFALRYRF